MAVTERGALLALLRASEGPWGLVTDVVEYAGSTVQVLRDGLPGQATLDEQHKNPNEEAERSENEIQSWAREGMRFLTRISTQRDRRKVQANS